MYSPLGEVLGDDSDGIYHLCAPSFSINAWLICDTFSCHAALLSHIAAVVATTSGKSLQNSCLFAKTVISLHRRKETDDKINNKYKH